MGEGRGGGEIAAFAVSGLQPQVTGARAARNFDRAPIVGVEMIASRRGSKMRIAAMGFVGALALIAATAANAAPSVPAPAGQQNIIAVAGGCGWGLHPNRWGDCAANRYGYHRADRLRDRFYGGRAAFASMELASPIVHIAKLLARRKPNGG